jgi:hypothetical protein
MGVLKIMKVVTVTQNSTLAPSYKTVLTKLFGVGCTVVTEFVILLSYMHLICASRFSVCCFTFNLYFNLSWVIIPTSLVIVCSQLTLSNFSILLYVVLH